MGLRRELCAEFLATFVLMMFGLGVNLQVTLGTTETKIGDAEVVQRDHGDFFTINAGWGIAVALGAFVGGGVSGAHMNPAVTIAMAVRGQFCRRKVLPFIGVQLAAAILASALVTATYYQAIAHYEKAHSESPGSTEVEWKKTAGSYATYPRGFDDGTTVSNAGGLLDQIVGTALLLICVCALGDSRNIGPKSNLAPLAVGAIVWMIGMSFGSNCGYAINPARDFGPRLFTWMGGWEDVFSNPNGWWWLIPIVGPIVGGALGVLIYDLFVTRWHSAVEQEASE